MTRHKFCADSKGTYNPKEWKGIGMSKTNVEMLHEHKALDGQDLTDAQLDVLNKEFTPEEMKTLVKLRTKVMDHESADSSKGGVF